MNRISNILLIAGILLVLSGLFIIIDDSISGGWCPPSRSKFNIKDYVNGPLLLIIGALVLIFPIYKMTKKTD